MNSEFQATSASKKMLWAGYVVSALPVLCGKSFAPSRLCVRHFSSSFDWPIRIQNDRINA